jgi:hypothetical protein
MDNKINDLLQTKRNTYQVKDKELARNMMKPSRKDTLMNFTDKFDSEFPPLDAEYILPW